MVAYIVRLKLYNQPKGISADGPSPLRGAPVSPL